MIEGHTHTECVWLNLKRRIELVLLLTKLNMNLYFYLLLFIIGTLFGSFYTLAVYRIPKRQDITHTHSYCPNCHHKLGFLDLIPIGSYLILKGKCRYCKEKIRPRYLILEILSGLLFVLLAMVLNFKVETLTSIKIIQYGFLILYLTFMILIIGIDKEKREIDKLVSVFGTVISIMYMVYLYIVEKANIYRYGIYLIFYIIILLLNRITLKTYAKNNYVRGILFMMIPMVVFTNEYITISSIIATLLAIIFYLLIDKIMNKKWREQTADKLRIGFLLGTFNIIILILVLWISNIRT